MELLVDRENGTKTEHSTISKFYIDGKNYFVCLEPTDRGLTSDMPLAEIKAKKIAGKTAIPTGRYEMDWYYSPKHKMFVPRILGVPDFDDAELHAGNFPKDTLGCILLGMSVAGPDDIAASKVACAAFYLKFRQAIRNEKVFITIK